MNDKETKSTEISITISKCYPFVYEIKGWYYFIGMSVFRDCTDEEIKEYNRYRKELAKHTDVGKYDIPETVESLAESVQKLINIGNREFDCRNAGKARYELEKLLKQQSGTTLTSLKEQNDDFRKAIELRDRYQIKLLLKRK